jgi:pyruvate carboxylase subunit B
MSEQVEGTPVKAPMICKVITVHVKEGDEVKENDPVVTIEAMKVEMPVVSPVAGVVRKVNVKAEDVIEADTVIAIVG